MIEIQQNTDKKVVIDFDAPSDKAREELIRHITHLADYYQNALQIEVVVYGDAIGMLTKSESDRKDELEALRQRGVILHACANAMKRHGISESDLLEGATSVPSGIGRIVAAQYEGAAYIKA